jgi:hypothetical protein
MRIEGCIRCDSKERGSWKVQHLLTSLHLFRHLEFILQSIFFYLFPLTKKFHFVQHPLQVVNKFAHFFHLRPLPVAPNAEIILERVCALNNGGTRRCAANVAPLTGSITRAKRYQEEELEAQRTSVTSASACSQAQER